MRNVVMLVIAALCTSGLVAYAGGAEQQQLTVDERIKRIDDFMRDRPSFLQKQSLEEFRGLAKIQGEKMEKVPNRHVAGDMLEYRQLRFNGLELYGQVTSSQEFSPIVVTVTTPNWKIARGLDVGTPAGRIEALLGPPMVKTDMLLEYQGTSDIVKFHVGRGVIRRIELVYYHD